MSDNSTIFTNGTSECNGNGDMTHNCANKRFMIRGIACFGAGYVGGPTCAVMAMKCPELSVYVVDINEDRINAWNSDNLPCYEPGLDHIVKLCRNRNLFFTTDFKSVIEKSQLIFISVNTPTKRTGFGQGRAPDMQYIDACTRLIAEYAKEPKIVVEKSTVPVHAAKLISNILYHTSACGKSSKGHIVLSNPEFLAEGTAVENLLHPDRIIIGGPDTEEGFKAITVLADIYSSWIDKNLIITMNTWSAELSKLVANAVLAQRISSINSISAICDVTDANIMNISEAVGMDKRIGPQFLTASLGFGGSCLEKDVLCLVYLAETLNMTEVADYWMQVISINTWQKKRFSQNIVSKMFNSVTDKLICILGYAFKKDTADLRCSAAIDVSTYLLEEGARLSIYDPKVPKHAIYRSLQKASEIVPEKSVFCYDDAYSAAENSHALIVCTEWDEFQKLDFDKIYKSMRKPAFVFDGRLLLNIDHLREIGYLAQQEFSVSFTEIRLSINTHQTSFRSATKLSMRLANTESQALHHMHSDSRQNVQSIRFHSLHRFRWCILLIRLLLILLVHALFCKRIIVYSQDNMLPNQAECYSSQTAQEKRTIGTSKCCTCNGSRGYVEAVLVQKLGFKIVSET
ncbi:hypothetical protein GJ496_008317 [Pomphorhynchus laevis]|nr:hypothetical protein GJ496_008317 [Pomphorhynchus laevis]